MMMCAYMTRVVRDEEELSESGPHVDEASRYKCAEDGAAALPPISRVDPEAQSSARHAICAGDKKWWPPWPPYHPLVPSPTLDNQFRKVTKLTIK